MVFGFGRRFGRGGRGFRFGRGPLRLFRQGQPENCICPNCKTEVPHRPGLPCFQTKCPKCGSPMTRKFYNE